MNVDKTLKWITLLFLMVITDSGCREHAGKETNQDVVTTWIGRTIRFPQDNVCWVLGAPTSCKKRMPKRYNILLYIDSTGCSSCKLKIYEWKLFMKDLDTLTAGGVNFIFYFNPKKDNDLSDMFKRENFRKEVHIDSNDDLNRINNFSKKMEYQCFLLDEHDKILVVGNPVISRSVRNLYLKTIRERLNLYAYKRYKKKEVAYALNFKNHQMC